MEVAGSSPVLAPTLAIARQANIPTSALPARLTVDSPPPLSAQRSNLRTATMSDRAMPDGSGPGRAPAQRRRGKSACLSTKHAS